jgi:LDH2 family malate/lactate/ureidoglycolate dehydrogenase
MEMTMNDAFISRKAYRSEELLNLATELLIYAGADKNIASVVANTLLEGDLLGHDTHGLALLAGYINALQTGSMTPSGHYQVLSDKPGVQLWDGMRLPGPWLIEQGIDVLIPRARDLGVASLVIRRSHHIACLAVYLMRVAKEGLLMLLASSDPASASVAPYGGTQAVMTPNPIAMGVPCSKGDLLIDISSSITTNGMSNRKAAAGEKFAEDWLMDAAGNSSNDPEVFKQNPPGTILPIGGLTYGHKGYGLGLMVEALTGGLAGWGRVDPNEGWGATVHITLYDPAAFGGNVDFLRQIDHLAESCLNNTPRPGSSSVRLPGQAGQALRLEQMQTGVRLHPGILPALAVFADKAGLIVPNSL